MKNQSSLLGYLDAKAFTLIELLVVVLIIGILAAVALPQYQKAVMRSRYATLKSTVDTLYQAEEIYKLANGEYTTDLDALSVDLTGCTLNDTRNICTYSWGFCMTQSDSVNPRVHCENTSTLSNAYVRYFNRENRGYCWAYTTDGADKYSKLCQKETGENGYYSTCVNNRSCWVF